MHTWKLEIEYEGTRYRGWQIQHNERTVQGELIKSARELFSEKVAIVAAAGTDPGVHAIGQIAHLKISDLKENVTPRMIQRGFNGSLPHDINILNVQNAPEKFHARRDAITTQYVYKIATRRTAFGKNLVWWVKDELDVKKMHNAAKMLIGRQDLSSFSLKDDTTNQSPILAVKRVEVFLDSDTICFRIRASRFLWEMVRRITGALVEVGRGNLSEKAFQRLIKYPSNAPQIFISPASGLFLEKVYYKS